MKWAVLSILWFTAVAGASPLNLAQRYEALGPETRQQYDILAQSLKPTLSPLEARVRSLARNDQVIPLLRLEKLQSTEDQLLSWIGDDVRRYAVLLPLLYTLSSAQESVAQSMPIITMSENPQMAIKIAQQIFALIGPHSSISILYFYIIC